MRIKSRTEENKDRDVQQGFGVECSSVRFDPLWPKCLQVLLVIFAEVHVLESNICGPVSRLASGLTSRAALGIDICRIFCL